MTGTQDADLAGTLGRFDIFAGLARGTLAALAAAARRRSWPAGATVFQRGDEGDCLLAITEGRLRLTLGTTQGRELVLRHLEAGDVVGELAVIDGEPRSADAAALVPTRAIVIARDRFLAVAAAHPDLGLAVARHLCAMLRNTNFQMESIALYDLQMRVVRFFLFSVRQIHGDAPPDETVLRLGLSQSDLSAVLGASRPKINQALQALIAAGAIRREGDSVVCVLPILRRMAEIEDPRDAF